MTSTTTDHQQIDDLMVRYMDLLDAGDYEGYAKLFAPNAVLVYGQHRLRGREQIREVVQEELEGLRNPKDASGRALPAVGMHHLLLNPIVAVNGDEAKATATWIFVKVTPAGQTELWGAGRYIDSLVRVGGNWRFQSREVTDTVAETVMHAREGQ